MGPHHTRNIKGDLWRKGSQVVDYREFMGTVPLKKSPSRTPAKEHRDVHKLLYRTEGPGAMGTPYTANVEKKGNELSVTLEKGRGTLVMPPEAHQAVIQRIKDHKK